MRAVAYRILARWMFGYVDWKTEDHYQHGFNITQRKNVSLGVHLVMQQQRKELRCVNHVQQFQ